VTRVLVTGATGFVGRNALGPLLELGFEVHAVTHARARENIERGVAWHRADLLDPAAARALVREVEPTHLLHLAWYAEHGRFWSAPENERWLAASARLLHEFAKAEGARVVVAGTCAEYDWSGDGVLSEHATPLRPRTLYGETKNALREELERLDLSSAWGRIFFLYGPHEAERRLVASVARALVRGEPAPLSPGRQVRDFLHVADAADALVRLLASEVEGPVNVGSGEGVAVATVGLELGELTGRPELVQLGALPAASDEPPLLVADVARLRDEVGWRPARSLREGLRGTLAWWADRVAR
jgi:nucleoside-diphosphate-sugar epimerase